MKPSILKSSILLLSFLCAIDFFSLKWIGIRLVSNGQIIGVGLFIGIIIALSAFPAQQKVKRHFSMPLNFLFFSILLSSIGALTLHNQPLLHSLIAARVLFYYLFYRVLHILQPTQKELVTTISIIAVLYLVIYAIQYWQYPNEILITRMDEDRAKVRIRLSGYAFVLFQILLSTYTYSLLSKKISYLVVSLVGSIFIIFLSIRIVIISTFIAQILIVLRNNLKAIVGLTILIVFFALLAPFIIRKIDPRLIDNLVERTERDRSKEDDYIRLIAFRYYLAKMRAQPLSYVTGHGNPTGGEKFASHYSKETTVEKQMGLFLDDLGQFGSYYRFGIPYILFIVILYFKVWKAFKGKSLKDVGYIGYLFCLFLLISITIPVFVTHPDFVIIVCISLYLIDTALLDQKKMKRSLNATVETNI